MRKVFLLAITLLAAIASTTAQIVESFDIATFRAPSGWAKQVKDGALLLSTSNEKAGSFALITLYPSTAATPRPSGDFDADWQAIAGSLGTKLKPEMEPQKQVDGWTVTTGGAAFTGVLGPSAIIMRTYSGYGRKFSCAAIFNTQDYIAAIDAFASSINLKKTPPAAVPTTAAPASDTSILGTWGQNKGAHMSYGDPVAAGMAGYSKDQYTFNADGTYVFNSKTFRMSFDKILLVRESGSYSINGSNLTIKPAKSIIQAWSKLNGVDKFGQLMSTQPRKLETVTYRFTRHYFSGIDQWQLVLQADSTTERDGPFSTFTLFPNAWYYSPISSNNPVIELPR